MGLDSLMARGVLGSSDQKTVKDVTKTMQDRAKMVSWNPFSYFTIIYNIALYLLLSVYAIYIII